VAALTASGLDVIVQPHRAGRVDLGGLLDELGRRGILSVLVEGGAVVNASVVAGRLVDKVVVLVAPRVLGGAQALGPIDGAAVGGPLREIHLRDVTTRRLGEDVAIEGYVEA
jgi:diaminohydroxyphosphoribosylaminopyrimidine deaminase/5-amino-6-(5-phosphoribosylamino)uracil reductase